MLSGGRPNTRASPSFGAISPSSSLIVVLLPEPFGPSNPNTSPGLIRKSKWSSATSTRLFQESAYRLVKPTVSAANADESIGIHFR